MKKLRALGLFIDLRAFCQRTTLRRSELVKCASKRGLVLFPGWRDIKGDGAVGDALNIKLATKHVGLGP